MKNVEVYSKKQCPFCDRAKLLLGSKGIAFREIDITDDEAVGGYDQLARLNAQGVLNRKLGLEETPVI